MSSVVSFSRRAPAAAVAKQRLEGIWSVVETHLSRLTPEHLTAAEMNRILRIFNTANDCIRIVLSDFSHDPAFDHLIGRSREIKALIDAARERVAGLPATARSA